MNKVLARIQELVESSRIEVTTKAADELHYDDLAMEDIKHVIISADHITDSYPSSNPAHKNEMLYVIIGPSVNGEWIYTKGAIRHNRFYVLISAHLT